jgi:hypothetical protein
MSDKKELVKRLLDWSEHDEGKINDARQEAADRIEALEQHVADLLVDLPCGCGYDNPTDVCMKHLPLVRKLTEQLEAARADAKEAEAYAEELAGDQVDLCRQLIAAEDKLAKAMEGLREIASEASVTVHTHNKGGINYTRMYEDWRKLAVKRIDKARATLAEIEGGKA